MSKLKSNLTWLSISNEEIYNFHFRNAVKEVQFSQNRKMKPKNSHISNDISRHVNWTHITHRPLSDKLYSENYIGFKFGNKHHFEFSSYVCNADIHIVRCKTLTSEEIKAEVLYVHAGACQILQMLGGPICSLCNPFIFRSLPFPPFNGGPEV